MAKQAWTDLSILYGEYDVAARAKTFEAPTVQVAALDSTPLSASSGWVEFTAGLKAVEWTGEVMNDFAASQVDDLLGLSGSTFNASTPISVLPAGTSDGSVAYTFRAIQFEYAPFDAEVGELAMARISGRGKQGPVVRGEVLHPPATARTATGNGTGQQLGALSSSQSLYAALHISAASGTSPTLDVVVESDDNGSFTTPTSRITFTQATTTGWQWSSVAGAITDDYWRITYTIGGTSPSFEFAVIAGIATTV